MSVLKTLAVATALVFGASQLALAQSAPASGGAGTESGKVGSSQNNDRGPGKNFDSGQGQQGQ
ncbi:MAG TPA: hypothetical protein VMR17_21185 [Xanthobacteraceae bacterium]|jgi:Spy/CpxP family protein refolding chaperone|nr:hypothetical protein [Xanthobacteraceae bacterium]